MGQAFASSQDLAVVALREAGMRVVFGHIDDAPYVYGEGLVILSTAYPDAAERALREAASRWHPPTR